MKNLWAIALAAVMASGQAMAAETANLDQELNDLQLPQNQNPLKSQVDAESLYSVQTRYRPLAMTHEISIGTGKNFTNDGFMLSNELNLDYRFHLSDRWNLNLSGDYVFNSWSAGANAVMKDSDLVPDVAFAKTKVDLSVGFNVFYGKFRFSMDNVVYFDQYVQLGGGLANLNSGQTGMVVGEAGFVFWVGKIGSVRIDAKDFVYKEQRQLSSGVAHNVVGQISLGVLLGGTKTI